MIDHLNCRSDSDSDSQSPDPPTLKGFLHKVIQFWNVLKPLSVWWSLLKCGTWHDGQRANSYPAALKLGSNKNPASKGRLSRAHIDWTFIDAFWGGVQYNLGAVFVWRASQKQIFGLVGNLSWACTTSGPRGSALISIIGQNHGTHNQPQFWCHGSDYFDFFGQNKVTERRVPPPNLWFFWEKRTRL